MLDSDRDTVDSNYVSFERRPVKNNFRSAQENRPIYDEVDYIIIQPPGHALLRIETPVTVEHKNRYPRIWAAYQNALAGKAESSGTPVMDWPLLTKAQAMELKGLNFHTVEQIAHATDQQIAQVQMIGANLREKARSYLKIAADSTHMELEEQKASQMAAENAELKRQLAELQAQVADLSKTQKRGPGRPPKPADDAGEAA